MLKQHRNYCLLDLEISKCLIYNAWALCDWLRSLCLRSGYPWLYLWFFVSSVCLSVWQGRLSHKSSSLFHHSDLILIFTCYYRMNKTTFGIFTYENRVPGEYALLQTALLYMKKTESPMFVLLCVRCFHICLYCLHQCHKGASSRHYN